MGMNVVNASLLFELKTMGLLDEVRSVLDMGAQEVFGHGSDFATVFSRYQVNADAINEFCKDNNFPKRPRLPSSRIWNLVGNFDCHCSDIINDHGAISLDLNYQLDKSLYGQFDFVTDFGNNEHPFNVGEAYRSMHRLAACGGFIWINQTILKGNGFYNFDISFFENLAKSNCYDIVFSAAQVFKDNKIIEFAIHDNLYDVIDLNGIDQLGVTYLFRKVQDNDFVFPVQGESPPGNERRNWQLIFRDSYLSGTRAYIPQQAELSFKSLIRALLKKIKARIS